MAGIFSGGVSAAPGQALSGVDDEVRAILGRLTERDVPAVVSWDARFRSLISVASLTALGDETVLEAVLAAALKENVTPVELREAAVQAMAYAGLPASIRALGVLEGVCTKNGVTAPLPPSGTVTDENRFDRGVAVQTDIFGEAIAAMHKSAAPDEKPLMVDLLSGYCFGDTYTRKDLTLKERELLTFVVIASLGGCDPQVKAHVNGCRRLGYTKKELLDTIAVMLPFIGFPKTLNALAAVNAVMPKAAAEAGQS